MSPKQPKAWFRVQNVATDATSVDIHIIDLIGDWYDEIWKQFGLDLAVTAKSFVDELAALDPAIKTINVHINSPGGDVQAGVNIANALRAETAKGRTVNTYVDGMAASIASVIAMAGTNVFMADNALMMIHDPFCQTVGNSTELRKTADVLDVMRGQIINTYKWHSTMESDAIAQLMVAETWMNADEAIANGFATDKVVGLQAAASINRSALAALNVPEKYRDQVKAFFKPEEKPQPPPATATALEILNACEAAGCPEMAKELLTANASVAQVNERVTERKNAKTAATARENAINALLATAKLPTSLAAGYIKGGMAVDDVRAHLSTIKAIADQAAIDGNLLPDDKKTTKAVISSAAIYEQLNNQTTSR